MKSITYTSARKKLRNYSSSHRKSVNMYFFKTGKGEYGEGDEFIGVSMPDTRKVVGEFHHLALKDVLKFVTSKVHEERMCGLLMLVKKYQIANKSDDKKQKDLIFKTYLKHFKYVNNWDLVDCTAHLIVGPHLINKSKQQLTAWAKSSHLWTRRISILSTFHFIKQQQLRETFRISKILLNDEHDLIHKAVGWMLREAGKMDQKKEEEFLNKYATKMPRTMLRYAIEKFPEKKRKYYLKME